MLVNEKETKVISNGMVDIQNFVGFDAKEECGINERVRFSVLAEIMETSADEEEMKEAVEPMHKICEQLLDDIKRDSESFDLYMQALTLPKETEEEKAARTAAMQNGLKAAVAVPLSVAKAAYEVLPFAETMVVKGNKTAVTDALVATMMARTAVLGALFNVKINLESIKDEEFVKETSKEVEVLEKKAIAFEQKILAQAQVSKSVVE